MKSFKEYTATGNEKPYCKLIRIIAFTVILIFSLHIYILPSAWALTVDEAAKGNKPQSSVPDEDFTRKTPADRTQPSRSYTGGQSSKDPRLACLLSLVLPGGGQVYLKQDLKGIAFFSLTVAGYSASGYYMYKAITGDLESSEKKSTLIISGLFFMVGMVFHVVGIVEAYNDAIEINEKDFYFGGYSASPFIAELDIKQ